MDKDILGELKSHSISLIQRKSLNITGVKKIENFDENQFLLDTSMGYIMLKGSNLEIIKLDTLKGDISIKGKVDSLVYMVNSKKSNKESLITKLFK